MYKRQTLYRLKHPQHPGDASLGQSLIDDIRLGNAQLGQSLFQVVEHDGHRPVLADVLGAALPGEGIDIGENGLRVGLHRSQHRRIGGLRGRGGRRLLGTAGGQGEQKRAAYQKGEDVYKRQEDAVQEAICAAFAHRGDLRDPQCFKPWLLRIVVNTCYELCRKQKKVIDLGQVEGVLEAPNADPTEAISLWQAVLALPESLRTAVTLFRCV